MTSDIIDDFMPLKELKLHNSCKSESEIVHGCEGMTNDLFGKQPVAGLEKTINTFQ